MVSFVDDKTPQAEDSFLKHNYYCLCFRKYFFLFNRLKYTWPEVIGCALPSQKLGVDRSIKWRSFKIKRLILRISFQRNGQSYENRVLLLENNFFEFPNLCDVSGWKTAFLGWVNTVNCKNLSKSSSNFRLG
jgi:hypothetical protein